MNGWRYLPMHKCASDGRFRSGFQSWHALFYPITDPAVSLTGFFYTSSIPGYGIEYRRKVTCRCNMIFVQPLIENFVGTKMALNLYLRAPFFMEESCLALVTRQIRANLRTFEALRFQKLKR